MCAHIGIQYTLVAISHLSSPMVEEEGISEHSIGDIVVEWHFALEDGED